MLIDLICVNLIYKTKNNKMNCDQKQKDTT